MSESEKMLPHAELRQTDEGLWNIGDVAAYLSVSVNTVRAHMKVRGMPCKRVGGRLYFRRAEVDAWVDSQGEAA